MDVTWQYDEEKSSQKHVGAAVMKVSLLICSSLVEVAPRFVSLRLIGREL